MGSNINFKIGVLILIFFITSIFVYWPAEPRVSVIKPKMEALLLQEQGYRLNRKEQLSEDAIKMLKIDDYTFANYESLYGNINVFIGYYYNASNAYASHSPMICYPSQGWKIDKQPTSKTFNLANHKINYEQIITSYGNRKELVLYWNQSHLLTNTNSYINKFQIAYNKLFNNSEHHAFVRVTFQIITTPEKAQKAAHDFISVFYPAFVDYLLE